MEPLVSVVVITYNQELFLPQTLDSILAQKVDFPIEIIIGEDCSTDNTKKVCVDYYNKYPQVIRLLLQEKNQGLLRNYNSVLNACRGKYIAQCAGDDYWCDNDKLKIQVDFLEKNSDYGLVHGKFKQLNSRTGKIVKTKHFAPSGFVFKDLLEAGNHISAPTVMFRKDLLSKIDIESFIDRGFIMEDYPMWIEFSRYCKFYFFDRYLACYRLLSESVSHFKSYDKERFFLDNVFSIRDYYRDSSVDFELFEHNKKVDLLALSMKHNRRLEIKRLSYCLPESNFKQRVKKKLLLSGCTSIFNLMKFFKNIL